MKGVVAAEFLTLTLLVGVLYLLWIHDEQLRDLERASDQLRVAVGELAAAKPPAKPRASRAKPNTNGKAD